MIESFCSLNLYFYFSIEYLQPESKDGVIDGPADDEGGGRVQGHLRHVADALRQPDVRQGDLNGNEFNQSLRHIRSLWSMIIGGPIFYGAE